MSEDPDRNRTLTETDGYHAGAILLPVLIILVVSFAVYFNALSDGFVYDDNFQVLKNQWMKDIRYIPEIFSKSVWSFELRKELSLSNYYRPIMHLIYTANYHLFGMRPWGFHLVNILFHAGVSVLVFLIALRLFGEVQSPSPRRYLSAPFWAGVLFAAHPVHTEAVTWISALPEVSFAFFFLLSLYLYIRFREGSGTAYPLSIASFFIATLCKETAVTLPLIIAGYDYFIGNTKGRLSVHLKRYIPYLVVTGFYFVLRFNALGGFAPVRRHAELTTYQSIINIFPLFTQYIGKLCFPLRLNAYHVFHPIYSIFAMKGILSLAITAALVVLVFTVLKKYRVASFSVLLIVVPLLPAFYITLIRGVTFAERYLYLPSFGFVVLLALLMVRARVKFSKGNTMIAIGVIALSGLYSAQTVIRNGDWKDDFTLFKDTVRKSPDGDVPHHQLGIAYAHMGRIDEAISEFKTVLKLNPERAESHNSLGIAYLGLGRIDEAISEFKATLKLRPEYTEPHYSLGIAYTRLGRIDEAIGEYKAVLELNPGYAAAHNNLGIAYLGLGHIEEAINEYKAALKLNPEYVDAHNNLGTAYARLDRMDEAINEYKAALKLDPDNTKVRHNLDTATERLGRTDKAINKYKTASKLASDNAEDHYKLGATYARLGRTSEAISEYKAGLKLNPGNASAHNNLGIIYAELGRTEEAADEYKVALKINPNDTEARYNLGTAYARLGRTNEAISEYKAGLRLNPDNASAHNNLGTSYARLGHTEEAISEYRTALKLDPDNSEVHYNLGIAYARLGRMEDAVNEYRAAVKLAPDHIKAHYSLGLACAHLGRIDEAVGEFRTVLKLDPNHVKAHYNLGIAYARLSRVNDAVSEFETVLKLNPDNAEARKNYELLNKMMEK